MGRSKLALARRLLQPDAARGNEEPVAEQGHVRELRIGMRQPPGKVKAGTVGPVLPGFALVYVQAAAR